MPLTTTNLPDMTSAADFLRAFNAWHPFPSAPGSKTDHLHERVVLEPLPEILDNGMAKAAYYFFVASARVMKTRVVFATEQGRLGIGARGLRAGDAVVVLVGADDMFLVRGGVPEGHWRLVGQSFVWGVMGVEEPRAGSREVEEFHVF
jgi:hypothetical protein